MKAHCPDYQLIWNVQKGYEAVFKKEKVPYVIKYSYRGLLKWAQTKYWVNNSRWPLWLPKPNDTVYLQTWHGTPLKRLGVDIEHITMPGMTLQKYHSQFTSEARKWDYCLAPNAYSSERAVKALLSGKVTKGWESMKSSTIESSKRSDQQWD